MVRTHNCIVICVYAKNIHTNFRFYMREIAFVMMVFLVCACNYFPTLYNIDQEIAIEEEYIEKDFII